VSHDCAQQTLHAPAGSPSGEVVASLSLTEAASWLAVERSARQKAPISTSLRLTYGLISVLEDRGLVRLDIEGRAPSVKRSIFDPVCWTVCIPSGAGEAELEALLLDRVRSLAMSTESAAERVALWRALAYAEAESYLAAQLRKHGFDPTWAERLLAALEHEWSGVPLARRRYLIWASVRQGASIYMQSSGDLTRSFSAIETELRRRGRWLAATEAGSQVTEGTFLPYPSWIRPLLLDIYLSEICDEPETYWTASIPTNVSAQP